MKKLFLYIFISVLLVSCSSGPSAEEYALTIVAETAAAASPTPEPTSTDLPAPTATFTSSPVPTETPTETPEPTATDTPEPTATPGPFVFADDFSAPTDNWLNCEICSWHDGALFYGPFSAEGAYQQQIIFCRQCGIVGGYKMSADIRWVEGQSDRGYGLLLNLSDDRLITLDVTPWKTVDIWKAEADQGWSWDWVNGGVYAAVNANNNSNRLEVNVVPTGNPGRADIHVSVNGQSLFVAFNQKFTPGVVGLTMFGHAVEISYDNFYFEVEEQPEPLPSDSATG
jgi:hypothetical protein